MCVCFFLKIHVLKIFIERWFWELNMLIGSLVELHIGFHSCLCFSHLEKLFLKKSCLDTFSIPCCLSSFFSFFLSQSRQLLDTWWIDWEWLCILDSFSTLGGSIELQFLFWWVVPWHLLNTSAVDDHFLDTFLDRCLDTSRHLHLSRYTAGSI